MRKVAFEISDNSIQASSSYAGPSVFGFKVGKVFCRDRLHMLLNMSISP